MNNYYNYTYIILYKFSPKAILDSALIVIVLNSGIVIFPGPKKSKSLGEYCKEAVEDNQREEERALVPIKNRLRGRRVHDRRIQVDLLLELAELECKKALADMYHYGTEEERNSINEEEMKTIARVAYHKVTTNDGGEENNNGQQYNTREGAPINGPTEREDNISEDEMQVACHSEGGESDDLPYNTRQGASINAPTETSRLLGDTRRNNNNNYSHFN